MGSLITVIHQVSNSSKSCSHKCFIASDFRINKWVNTIERGWGCICLDSSRPVTTDMKWLCCPGWRSEGHHPPQSPAGRTVSPAWSHDQVSTVQSAKQQENTEHRLTVVVGPAQRYQGDVSLSASCEATRVYWCKEPQGVRGRRWRKAETW